MSYDVSFRFNVEGAKDGCVSLDESFNMTSNVAPMYHAADHLWIGDLNEKPAKEVIGMLRPAIAYMETHPEEMRKLEPENGWGHFESALKFLRDILDVCADNPACIVHVWY
jgi:hypothetical protein